MKSVSILIKPASGLCNLRCRYCFYADEMKNRFVASYGVMNTDTLECIVKRVFAEVDGMCTFSFQGGEPTLAGLNFFKQFIAFVKRYNTRNIKTDFVIQTNGYVVDENWVRFFAENQFLVGLSLDGYRNLHDLYRVDAKQAGTFDTVLRAAKLLQKYRVEFNILTVVTAQTARHIEKIYCFFKKNNFYYQQYIPCLDPLKEEQGNEPYSLTPERYAQFLNLLFDLWYADFMKGRFIYNRYFENLVGILLRQVPEACCMLGHCTNQFVVEADGSVYPCDFYVLDQYCIGNLVTDDFDSMKQNQVLADFIEKSRQGNETCKECRWYALCRGGCRRDRDYDGEQLQCNRFCSAYQSFFAYVYPRLQQVAEITAQRLYDSSLD